MPRVRFLGFVHPMKVIKVLVTTPEITWKSPDIGLAQRSPFRFVILRCKLTVKPIALGLVISYTCTSARSI